MNPDILGYIAAVFISVSFIPQVIKSYKTKSVEDVSIGLLIASIIGTAFWLMYGYILKNWPILVANTTFIVIVLWQLDLKIHYDKVKKKAAAKN